MEFVQPLFLSAVFLLIKNVCPLRIEQVFFAHFFVLRQPRLPALSYFFFRYPIDDLLTEGSRTGKPFNGSHFFAQL